MKGNMALHIDDVVLRKAFLAKFVSSDASYEDKISNFPISDEIRALAGKPGKDARLLDWKKEQEEYLSKKYGL